MTRKGFLMLTFIDPFLAFMFLRIFTRAELAVITIGALATFALMFGIYWFVVRKDLEEPRELERRKVKR